MPDLVMEVLANNRINEDISLYSTELRSYMSIMDRVIGKVVTEYSTIIVRDATNTIVSEYLIFVLFNKYSKIKV